MFNKFKNKNLNTETTPTLEFVESSVVGSEKKFLVGRRSTDSHTLVHGSNARHQEEYYSKQKPTIISEGAVLDGNLNLDGILHLDGKFKGNIKAGKVTIGRNGSFNGKLEAELLSVLGHIKGEVTCQDLILNSDSVIAAKVTYASISINSGASVSGELICKIK